jgi:glycerol 2-dehydrogenase (NADP+)
MDQVGAFLPVPRRRLTSFSRLTFKLNTGREIPAIGLGTWQSKPNEVRKAVKAALLAGYKHIDT